MATPKSTVSTEIIPYIFYRDVPAALDWLTRAFGFAETMRTTNGHRLRGQRSSNRLKTFPTGAATPPATPRGIRGSSRRLPPSADRTQLLSSPRIIVRHSGRQSDIGT
jgi:hypothetical protein